MHFSSKFPYSLNNRNLKYKDLEVNNLFIGFHCIHKMDQILMIPFNMRIDSQTRIELSNP
jgi:hypothetical protein